MLKPTHRKIVVFVASTFVTVGCLGGAVAAEEHADQHMPVLTSPTIHEGAQINTEIRGFYMYNKVPKGFVNPSGKGSINALMVQGRFALNDRWALLVRKLGYVWNDFQNSLPDDDGFANFTFGAKYAILAEPKNRRYLTVGTSYEAPSGKIDAGNIELQGGGSGMSDTFIAWSSRVGEKTAFQASAGFNMALDSDHDSSYFHYTFHVDHEVLPKFYALFEGNLLTTIREGDRTNGALFGDFEGYDLFNFGNTESGTIVTLGGGVRYRLSDYLMFGVGAEFPVSSNEDIVDFRILSDTTLQF